MPRFSVILPTHDRADVVGHAIGSVLAQSDPDFELFVLGDGCTDDTARVVQAFADPRVRWMDLPKAPYYGYTHRNLALKQAQGAYVAYIAHDDLLFPDHLARLAAQLERQTADWIFSRPLWVSMDGIVVPYAITLRHTDERASYMSVGNPIPMSCVVHRRSVVEAAGYWPEDVPSSADWAYWKKILASGAVLASCRVPTTLHFVANWRRALSLGQPEAKALLRAAQVEPWWPGELKQTIPAGETEQAVFARWLSGGAERIDALRDAVDTVIDRLAWDHTFELRNRASRRSVWSRISGRLTRAAG